VLNPAVLRLDEPLGALDAKLRRSLKIELKALQERVGITFLYVTHDQEEALTMSDRLAVMNAGRIVQIGTPARGLRGTRGQLRGRLPRRRQPDGGRGGLSAGRAAGRGLRADLAPVRGDDGHRARGDQAGAGADRGAWFGRREPGARHGRERVVFLGSATEVLLRLAPGIALEALMQNDGSRPDLAQGNPGERVPAAGRAGACWPGGGRGPGGRGRAAGRELAS